MRNEVKNDLMAYFPLYNFRISFIKSKSMATEKEGLKTLDFFCSGFLMYKGSYMHVMESNSALWVILGHPRGAV